MKKLAALTVFGLTMFFSTGAFSQSAQSVAEDKGKTKEVIESIPTLKSIAADVAKFESKVEGKKEAYKNASADLKALKEKYLNELNLQIEANVANAEVVSVLKEEAQRVKNEIKKLN